MAAISVKKKHNHQKKYVSHTSTNIPEKFGWFWPRGFRKEVIWNVNSCDLETKVICWPRHWYFCIFLVNKICVPNMIEQTSKVLEKLTFHYFCQIHAYGSQFDLYVDSSNINLGSSFVQILEALSAQFLIPCFKVLSFLVLEKIFKGFLPYMNILAILANRLEPFEQFSLPQCQAAKWNLVPTGPLTSEKFENVGGQGMDRWWMPVYILKAGPEPSAQVS